MIRSATLAAVVAALAACGSSPAPAPDGLRVNTNSPIAGSTLRCTGDYPDSRLVFAPDGTLSGRFAGQAVSGQWNALAPDRVEIVMRAGGIAVRDLVLRTAAGWRGENTSCG